jgi:N-acyl-D-amino-acid deacylase
MRRYTTSLILALALAGAAPLAAQEDVYDVVIRNGRIIDGTGSPWYGADLGIRGGRIAAIGRLDGAAARQTVDAGGLVVAPGFIDMLGQSEQTILVNPASPPRSSRASPPRSPARASRWARSTIR